MAKEVFIAVKRHDATVMAAVLILACPVVHIALKIVHHAPVIQTVK
jgi:hypothetical protein